VIKDHARLWHFYHDEIKGTGKVGMKFNDNFGIPLDAENPLDVEAAYQFNNAEIGVLADPIFLGKDYPEQFKLAVPDYIPLTPEDLAYMNGTSDYFAVDAYTTTVVSAPPDGITNCSLTGPTHPLYPLCVVQQSATIDGWNIGYKAKTFPYITPTYLRAYLNWGWNTYSKPVSVTEYGFSVPHEVDLPVSEQLFDSARSAYYLSFLQAMLQAIWEDNVHVLGALAWCYADNWEWGDFSSTYGLQYVNRTTQERRYRKSFFDMRWITTILRPPTVVVGLVSWAIWMAGFTKNEVNRTTRSLRSIPIADSTCADSVRDETKIKRS
jgi:beta-glucosidase/6-phospho-beta-glucosidase/beta-galactosidase